MDNVHRPSKREGPLWIVEPPLSTCERMSVNDPLQPLRSHKKQTFHRINLETFSYCAPLDRQVNTCIIWQ